MKNTEIQEALRKIVSYQLEANRFQDMTNRLQGDKRRAVTKFQNLMIAEDYLKEDYIVEFNDKFYHIQFDEEDRQFRFCREVDFVQETYAGMTDEEIHALDDTLAPDGRRFPAEMAEEDIDKIRGWIEDGEESEVEGGVYYDDPLTEEGLLSHWETNQGINHVNFPENRISAFMEDRIEEINEAEAEKLDRLIIDPANWEEKKVRISKPLPELTIKHKVLETERRVPIMKPSLLNDPLGIIDHDLIREKLFQFQRLYVERKPLEELDGFFYRFSERDDLGFVYFKDLGNFDPDRFFAEGFFEAEWMGGELLTILSEEKLWNVLATHHGNSTKDVIMRLRNLPNTWMNLIPDEYFRFRKVDR